MGLLDPIWRRIGEGIAKAQQGKYPPWMLQAAAGERWSMTDYGVRENQQRLYAKLTWVYAAVSAVSESVAATPFSVKQRVGEETEEIENHPFELLLQRPNPLMSRFEFLVNTAGFQMLTGNAYWWLNRPNENAPPSEMWIIPSHRIKPIPDERMFISGYEYDTKQGRKFTLLPWSVAHFKNFNPLSMFEGLSPIEAFAAQAEGELASINWNANWFGKENAKIPGILMFSEGSKDEKRLRDQIQQDYGGSERKGLMILFGMGEGDAKYIPTGMSRHDMEFLAGRNFTKREIYDIYAPGYAAMTEPNSTEASANTGERVFMKQAVYPMHVTVAEKITNTILPLYGDNLVGEFEDVRMSDRAMELKEQEAFASVHTVDEIRAEFYNAEPLGDERGEMLVAQISPMTPMPGGGGPALPGGLPPKLLETGGEQVEGEIIEQSGNGRKAVVIDVGPTPEQMVRDELRAYRRFVVNRMKAGKSTDALREFESEVIPVALKAAIEGHLEDADTVEKVDAIFADALTWGAYP